MLLYAEIVYWWVQISSEFQYKKLYSPLVTGTERETNSEDNVTNVLHCIEDFNDILNSCDNKFYYI